MPDPIPKPPVISSVPPRLGAAGHPVLVAPAAPSRVRRPVLPSWMTPAAPRPLELLTPVELERYKNLLVFARSTVEGYFTGKHKSPYRGSSVEFADYKEYVPGDELKRVDWRVFGRSRRLFVRLNLVDSFATVRFDVFL